MYKECLANGIVLFIISDDMKSFYYRGLAEWDGERGYLLDTCLAAKDVFRAALDYFRIAHGGKEAIGVDGMENRTSSTGCRKR